MTDTDNPEVWMAVLAALGDYTTPGPWRVSPELDGMLADRQTVVRAGGGHGRVVSVGQTRRHDTGRAEINVAWIVEAHKRMPELLELAREGLRARQDRCAAAVTVADTATGYADALSSVDAETPPDDTAPPTGGRTCKCAGQGHWSDCTEGDTPPAMPGPVELRDGTAHCLCSGAPGRWCTADDCVNNPPAVPAPFTVERGGITYPDPFAETVLDAGQTLALRAVLGVLARMDAHPDGHDAAEMLRSFPWHNAAPDSARRVTLVEGSHVLNARDVETLRGLLRGFMTEAATTARVSETARFMARQGW